MRLSLWTCFMVAAFAGAPPMFAADDSLSIAPARIIFDTDVGNDVDDVLALGMLHALETRGACKLLAVTITKCDEEAGPFVNAVNTFYGRADIPIGCIRRPPDKERSKFLSMIEARDGDALRYPHALRRSSDAPDAMKVLRQVLASQPDGSVSMVQVGYFSNFAELLDTPADEFSPLKGMDLVEQKVKLLSVMAGCFQTVNGNNHFCEYNVIKDIPAAQKLAREWPTPVVWSGFEIGESIHYPAVSIERDYNYAPHHPLKDAYYLYIPPPHERPTWDLTAAIYAVYPDRNFFGRSITGTVMIANDGFTEFAPNEGGRDIFLKVDPIQIARVREVFVQLCTQPSSGGAGQK
jgi:inosine-uridine nucleoside N-ribohydrolase